MPDAITPRVARQKILTDSHITLLLVALVEALRYAMRQVLWSDNTRMFQSFLSSAFSTSPQCTGFAPSNFTHTCGSIPTK